MTALREALSSPGFLSGLRLGAIAALVGVAGCWIWRSRTRRPASVVGLLLTSAALLALSEFMSVPGELLSGLGLLGVAGFAGTLSHSLPLNMVLALPGAWLISETVANVYPGWGHWALAASIAIVGPLAATADRQLSKPVLGPLLLGMTLAGIYLDVPDTEVTLVLVGVMAPLVLLGWPTSLSGLGVVGSYVAVGLIAWASAMDGVGRPGSIVGAIACFGIFVLIPVLVRDNAIETWDQRWVVGIHLLVVGVSSRIAGFRAEPLRAGVIAAAVLLVGAWFITRISRGQTN